MNLPSLQKQQQALAQQVEVYPHTQSHAFTPDTLACGLDVQYRDQQAFVALSLWTLGGTHVETVVYPLSVSFPYIPQYFCFRETPLLVEALQKLQTEPLHRPKLLIVDGHGAAHPRGLGVACLLGLRLALPTIGCAKRALLPVSLDTLKPLRGSIYPIVHKGKTVGNALRTQEGIKPVFVSVGHQMSLQQSTEIILQLSPTYRICEPLRKADQEARIAEKVYLGQ